MIGLGKADAIIFDLDETLVGRNRTMRDFLTGQYYRLHKQLDRSRDAFVATVIKAQ